jgi:hypothetical protein
VAAFVAVVFFLPMRKTLKWRSESHVQPRSLPNMITSPDSHSN